MDLQWLWQNVVSDLLATGLWLAIAAAGAAVLAYLRRRDSRWAAPIVYGLAAFALISVILVAFKGFIFLSKQQPNITLENIETNIKAWIDTHRLTVQKAIDQESHFIYSVTLPNSIKVAVKRTKAWDRYLTFQTNVLITQKEEYLLVKLPKEQERQLVNELILEMARLDIEWDIKHPPLRSIFLSKSVPITSNLTEADFIDYLHEMANAYILVNTRLLIALPGEQ